jgi:DnaK suppressor protein
MLTENERRQVEERLRKDREQVLEAIGHFEEADDELRARVGELSAYDNHPADMGSENQEQEQQFLLATIEGRRLYAIDDALRRLYQDPESFGLCEIDGEAIEFDRLIVVPETRVCARHARERDEAAGVDANPREADGTAKESA